MTLSDDEGGGEDGCSVPRLHPKVWFPVLVQNNLSYINRSIIPGVLRINLEAVERLLNCILRIAVSPPAAFVFWKFKLMSEFNISMEANSHQ